jgi:hypothetical protein
MPSVAKTKKDAGVSRVLDSLGRLVQLSVTANFSPTRQRRLCCVSIAAIIAENVQIHDGSHGSMGSKIRQDLWRVKSKK